MNSQTSTVLNLFAERSAKPSQQTQQKSASKIDGIPLQTKQMGQNNPMQKPISWQTTLLVLLAHAVVIYALATQNALDEVQKIAAKPMMVSLIAPQAPKPELVPAVVPAKPVIKSKPKLKFVEKIRPIEAPTERLVEATTEQIKEEVPIPQASSAPEPMLAKAASVQKVVEDVIESPRFGVSYLNNPAPDYPPMSRRIGEEGRVLMKVLVTVEGSAAQVEIEKTSGSERLDKAAMAAVKQWRFITARKNNQPLSAYVLVPIKFALDR